VRILYDVPADPGANTLYLCYTVQAEVEPSVRILYDVPADPGANTLYLCYTVQAEVEPSVRILYDAMYQLALEPILYIYLVTLYRQKWSHLCGSCADLEPIHYIFVTNVQAEVEPSVRILYDAMYQLTLEPILYIYLVTLYRQKWSHLCGSCTGTMQCIS
jgi:hypothetical protein